MVDTIGRQRFRVLERGMRDEYSVARVQLVQDDPIEAAEFNGKSHALQSIWEFILLSVG